MLTCRCAPVSCNPSPFTRILDPQRCGTVAYTRRNPPPCTHWGQLKLLLSEIEFLTPFYGQSLLVVYAGAAPGVHLPLLASMFESMRFVLVDPQPSMMQNGEYPNIEVVRDFMSDEKALEFAGKHLVFISDVRIGGEGGESDEAQQDRIQRDMDAQRRWLERMDPVASMLKFRLPWRLGVTNYLSGRIHFPVYGKPLTHEARLVVPRGACAVDYDNRRYEQHMAHFNRVLRPSVQTLFGRSCCYDCTAFRWIVCGYLLKTMGCVSAIDDRCNAIELALRGYMTAWKNAKNSDVCCI
jgi:cap2 methyltransferase